MNTKPHRVLRWRPDDDEYEWFDVDTKQSFAIDDPETCAINHEQIAEAKAIVRNVRRSIVSVAFGFGAIVLGWILSLFGLW
jgi:hypothetical protein